MGRVWIEQSVVTSFHSLLAMVVKFQIVKQEIKSPLPFKILGVASLKNASYSKQTGCDPHSVKQLRPRRACGVACCNSELHSRASYCAEAVSPIWMQ